MRVAIAKGQVVKVSPAKRLTKGQAARIWQLIDLTIGDTMADIWKEASFRGGEIKYKTVTDTSLVHQPSEPRTNKRLREENMMLASLTPEQQAKRLAACLIGDASLASDDFIQAYVGMYDDLITPPADSKVKCEKTLFLHSRIDSPHKTAIQAQPWCCLWPYQTNIGQFAHIPVPAELLAPGLRNLL